MEEILVVFLLLFIIPALVLISIPVWIIYGALLWFRSAAEVVFDDGSGDQSARNRQG